MAQEYSADDLENVIINIYTNEFGVRFKKDMLGYISEEVKPVIVAGFGQQLASDIKTLRGGSERDEDVLERLADKVVDRLRNPEKMTLLSYQDTDAITKLPLKLDSTQADPGDRGIRDVLVDTLTSLDEIYAQYLEIKAQRNTSNILSDVGQAEDPLRPSPSVPNVQNESIEQQWQRIIDKQVQVEQQRTTSQKRRYSKFNRQAQRTATSRPQFQGSRQREQRSNASDRQYEERVQQGQSAGRPDLQDANPVLSSVVLSFISDLLKCLNVLIPEDTREGHQPSQVQDSQQEAMSSRDQQSANPRSFSTNQSSLDTRGSIRGATSFSNREQERNSASKGFGRMI